MKILVTGAAGFIGSSLSHALLEAGHKVLGLDNLDPYYDVELKKARLGRLEEKAGFQFRFCDITDMKALSEATQSFAPDKFCHLAAQAGVRYSIENPFVYEKTNLLGFLNVLEVCRHQKISHLVYASTSSVYGLNESLPLSENQSTEHPVSLYGATKKANEMMAHSYASMYGLPCTGLRFFTVYGPWGRPDMALFLFTKNILEGKPIQVFNRGDHQRDFTYVSDIVGGVKLVLEAEAPQAFGDWNPKKPNPAVSKAAYRVYNIGRDKPVQLIEYIESIEKCLGKTAEKELLPMQAGDVKATWADVSALRRDFGYEPKVSVEEGVRNFVKWYREYYRV